MDKKLKIYIGLLVFIVLGIIYIELIKPKEINWFPSYDAKHKIPYGTYILHKEMPSLFANKKVRDVYQSPYLFLKDSINKGTYFFVDGKLNFGEEEFNELLKFVARGNDVFIATNGLNLDTLNIKTKQLSTTAFEEKAYQKIVNKKLDANEYHFDRDFPKAYFSSVDTLKTTVLGELLIKNEKDSIVSHKPNFIKTEFGRGSFYLHTFPQAFTNYNMLLDTNYTYVASVLSYLNRNNNNSLGEQNTSSSNSTILWDTYYKTGKSGISSPMHYILSSKHLKWAYYMALIGVLFFVIFKGKRDQRLIPVITPLKNQTLAFTRTIANMYYEKSDHKNIAIHKINYFLEYIRITHRLSTLKIDTIFYEKLASRSGNSLEKVEVLFKKITIIQSKEKITQEELIVLNREIEVFKK
ncbi:DUF4350 domain-containing protein [Tenacibaculum sp. Bg11-29]|uniref:DUF4350 domain-containing protein n=1 Tax=Tenacibaculum sp. Bg11-29 TaxID=2058306 RepID=UPI0012FEFECC|nr:DUF4350 domain-containing protein [Tenacibaculum sp. Bg11-29]